MCSSDLRQLDPATHSLGGFLDGCARDGPIDLDDLIDLGASNASEHFHCNAEFHYFWLYFPAGLDAMADAVSRFTPPIDVLPPNYSRHCDARRWP